jgi:hypothetical protein
VPLTASVITTPVPTPTIQPVTQAIIRIAAPPINFLNNIINRSPYLNKKLTSLQTGLLIILSVVLIIGGIILV